MKTRITKSLMSLVVVSPHSDAAVSNSPVGYIIGGIVALAIMVYLMYTLIRPEKF